MKHILRACLFSLTLLLVSCKDKEPVDPCAELDCGLHGLCVDGSCDCDAGWTGSHCAERLCVPACVNGTCVDGVCQCEAGYEGAACDVRTTAKFVGNYNVAEDCSSSDLAYTCEIQEAPTPQWIRFTNIHDFVNDWGITTPITATVAGENLSIPNQIVSNGTTSFSVSGGGYRIETGVVYVNLNYSQDGGFGFSCYLTMLPL